MQGQKGYNCC